MYFWQNSSSPAPGDWIEPVASQSLRMHRACLYYRQQLCLYPDGVNDDQLFPNISTPGCAFDFSVIVIFAFVRAHPTQ